MISTPFVVKWQKNFENEQQQQMEKHLSTCKFHLSVRLSDFDLTFFEYLMLHDIGSFHHDTNYKIFFLLGWSKDELQDHDECVR